MKRIALSFVALALALPLFGLAQELSVESNAEKAWCHTFKVNMRISQKGTEVATLQAALEKEGFTVSSTEKERKVYGNSTAAAVSAFQMKYKTEVLDPFNLPAGTGFVGKTTRAKLNFLYGCKIAGEAPTFTVETSYLNQTKGNILYSNRESDYAFVGRVRNAQPDTLVKLSLLSPVGDKLRDEIEIGRTNTVGNFSSNISGEIGKKILSGADGLYKVSVRVGPWASEAVTLELKSRAIEITSPAVGVVWQKGTTQTISWATQGVTWVDIKLRNSKGHVMDIATKIPAVTTRSYSWKVPTSLPAGNDYRIRLDSGDDRVKDGNVFSIGDATAPVRHTIPTEPVTPVSPTTPVPTITSNCPTGQCSSSGGECGACPVPTINDTASLLGGDTTPTPAPTPVTTPAPAPAPVPAPIPVPVTKSITVTSQSVDGNWYYGTPRTIRWTSAGVNLVNITLEHPTNGTVIKVASGVDASKGFYTWTVPSGAPSAHFRVFVRGANSSAFGKSSGIVYITSASASVEDRLNQMASALESISDSLNMLQKSLGQ